MNLTAENVSRLFMDSLYTAEEQAAGIDESKAIKVEGIVNNFGFNPERIAKNTDDIKSLVSHLPKEFHNNGWSFLNLPMDENGEQWGEQRNAEQLYALAAAIGAAEFLLPRAVWNALPGGVPYINFKV